jgi:hypothetical protein
MRFAPFSRLILVFCIAACRPSTPAASALHDGDDGTTDTAPDGTGDGATGGATDGSADAATDGTAVEPPPPPALIDAVTAEWAVSQTDLGAIQGAEVRDGTVYLYGDRDIGAIRGYDLAADGLSAPFVELALVGLRRGGLFGDTQEFEIISHPTGLTTRPGLGTFIGDTVNQKGRIFKIDWNALLDYGYLQPAVQNVVEDDLAVNGSRPELVRVGGRWLIASTDYGDHGNELRLYDPAKLAHAKKTSDRGVLVAKIPGLTWVQNLHWIDERGLLVFVQNITEGAGWRLSFVDLEAALAAGTVTAKQTIDFTPTSELEGFHMLDAEHGLVVASGGDPNLALITFHWVDESR